MRTNSTVQFFWLNFKLKKRRWDERKTMGMRLSIVVNVNVNVSLKKQKDFVFVFNAIILFFLVAIMIYFL